MNKWMNWGVSPLFSETSILCPRVTGFVSLRGFLRDTVASHRPAKGGAGQNQGGFYRGMGRFLKFGDRFCCSVRKMFMDFVCIYIYI